MKGSHTTTTAVGTYVRILLVLCISALFVTFIPYGGPENASFFRGDAFEPERSVLGVAP